MQQPVVIGIKCTGRGSFVYFNKSNTTETVNNYASILRAFTGNRRRACVMTRDEVEREVLRFLQRCSLKMPRIFWDVTLSLYKQSQFVSKTSFSKDRNAC